MQPRVRARRITKMATPIVLHLRRNSTWLHARERARASAADKPRVYTWCRETLRVLANTSRPPKRENKLHSNRVLPHQRRAWRQDKAKQLIGRRPSRGAFRSTSTRTNLNLADCYVAIICPQISLYFIKNNSFVYIKKLQGHREM